MKVAHEVHRFKKPLPASSWLYMSGPIKHAPESPLTTVKPDDRMHIQDKEAAPTHKWDKIN